MPNRSKFTAETRSRILEALKIGASRRTAAALARVGETTLRRWMEKGENSSEGSRFRQFHEEVLEAEAHPRERALGIIYREMADNPALAMKVIERREPGYAPPMPHAPQMPAGPVVINLSLSDGRQLQLPPPVIEGEVVDESDGSASSA